MKLPREKKTVDMVNQIHAVLLFIVVWLQCMVSRLALELSIGEKTNHQVCSFVECMISTAVLLSC
jgi:hypothetical protein